MFGVVHRVGKLVYVSVRSLKNSDLCNKIVIKIKVCNFDTILHLRRTVCQRVYSNNIVLQSLYFTQTVTKK